MPSMRRVVAVCVLTVMTMLARPAVVQAQQPCPTSTLHAYAHNDYENSEPFTLAAALGYRGVEADVFLVDGILRLGHDRSAARRGRPFEQVYLEPLRDVATRCGPLTPDGRGFFLAVEIKETSLGTFDSLIAVLHRYPDLFRPPPRDSLRPPSVEVVLVGWHPPLAEWGNGAATYARAQHLVSKSDMESEGTLPVDTTGMVRLVSLDYGKTMGRWFTSESERQRWLTTALAIKAQAPGRLLRVFNVPRDETVYRRLFAAGVDLIGTKTLRQSEPFLK